MSTTEHSADQLAQLKALDITLPAPVTTEITGYQAIMALPVAPTPEHGADCRDIKEIEEQLERDDLTGRRNAIKAVPLDVTPVR